MDNKKTGTIEDVIKAATEEFNKNGRSERFVKMENAVLTRKKPADIYFFARYAKGASVERFQNALIEQGAMMEGYYFQQNVEGADIAKFTNLAIAKDNKFWIGKFAQLAETIGEYDEVAEMIDGRDINIVPEQIRGNEDNINEIIKTAREYDPNSDEFKKIEEYVFHCDAIANSRLFMQHIPYADVKEFEKTVILRGDPQNMFIVAKDVKNINKSLMVRGLELAKLDYRQVEAGWRDIESQRARILSQIRSAERYVRPELLRSYDMVAKVPEYVAKIDNEYIASINYMIKQDLAKQKYKV